jgi:hypothetical protein
MDFVWIEQDDTTLAFNAQTGTTYTLVIGDVAKLVTTSNASAVTVTIPANVFAAGNQINVQSIATGQSTLLSAYNNPTNTYSSTLNFVAGDNIVLSTISTTNTVVFNVPASSNATIATLSTFLWNMSTLNSSFESNITAFNSPYSAQPFIQYGSATMNSSGQVTITLPRAYKNVIYTPQLTYLGSSLPVQALRVVITSSNTFVCYGDANSSFNWTTYGQIF